jgi:nicotinate-nucleotide--dimethylbenzimidazole phosphoribosyltransferase
MDVFEAIKGRRSIREYLPAPIPRRDIERILDAARYAPSAGNGQPWRFLILRGEENKAGLREVVNQRMGERIEKADLPEEKKDEHKAQYRQYIEKILAAPVLIFVFVDKSQHPDLVGYDGALAVQNMLLAAYALGYGSGYQTTIFPEDLVREHFGVPDAYQFICAVPIGKAVTQPTSPKRKALEELIWEECYPK